MGRSEQGGRETTGTAGQAGAVRQEDGTPQAKLEQEGEERGVEVGGRQTGLSGPRSLA